MRQSHSYNGIPTLVRKHPCIETYPDIYRIQSICAIYVCPFDTNTTSPTECSILLKHPHLSFAQGIKFAHITQLLWDTIIATDSDLTSMTQNIT